MKIGNTVMLQQTLLRFLLLMLLPLTIFLVSCKDEDEPQPDDQEEVDDDDDDNEEPAEVVTIVDLAVGSENLSTLEAALTRYDDLVAALSDTATTYTVFAPTNQAFTTLLGVLGATSLDDIPADLLKEVLQYHVIGGAALRSTDLSNGQTAATLLEGESITVTINGSTVLINTSTVVTANLEADNGIVHVIDAVLVPSYVPTQSIVSLAAGNENLSVLVEAVSKFDDLVAALSGSGSFTVFAPTDEAFLALLGIVGQEDLDDIPLPVLRRLLEYHVIGGAAVASTDLTNGQTVQTLLADESVSVGVSGSGVTINSSNVVAPDIRATNGIVHVVDAVLVPSLEASIVNTVVEPAYFNVNFTTLTQAVVTAGLLPTLINREADFTVFAPTNDAFEAAGITSLEGLTADDLTPILLYHVLDFEANAAAVGALGTGSAVPFLGGNGYLSINSNGIFINGTTQVVATDVEAENGVVHVINRTLTPPSQNVVEIAVAASQATNAQFGQLVAALTAVENDANAADLVTILSSTVAADGAPFTVFAPTDAAFEALYELAGVEDFAGLVAAIGIANVEAVLKYHVVSGARVFSTDLPNLSSNMVTTLGGTFTLDLSSLSITDTDAAFSLGSANATIVSTDILGTNGVIHVIDEVILP